MSETKIIAFAGKGGVGKTSLAALTVRLLTEAEPQAKILAIDADPAVGLSTALGVEVTHTLDDIRQRFIGSVEGGDTRAAIEILNEAHYEITDSVVETERFAFLAIGRPESAGCYCKVNSFLRDVIKTIAEDFDYVVIDGEAGIEQVNRRVMETVTHLILVSDASKKGLSVIQSIREVAERLGMYHHAGAIVNRLKSETVKDLVDVGDIPLLGFVPEDNQLAMLDIEGCSLMELPEDAPTLAALKEALKKTDII